MYVLIGEAQSHCLSDLMVIGCMNLVVAPVGLYNNLIMHTLEHD